MKTAFCDVCFAEEGTLTLSKKRWRISNPVKGGISIDVCFTHDRWGKGKSREEYEKILNKAEERFYQPHV